MKTIEARNVQQALFSGLEHVRAFGVPRASRAGPVLVHPGPVTTVYQKPDERVVFFPERDANPFFHFMEGLWMLSGRNDVEWISRYSSNIAQFSDNGVTFHGAYGKRWRNYFPDCYKDPNDPMDQLAVIAQKLHDDPNDRRAVLQMWDGPVDLCRVGKDVPCNLMANFQVNQNGLLDMIVFNRSNDIIWGAYGANAVHFSMLHEVLAAWVGVPLGRYWQVSANWHAYEETLKKTLEVLEYPFYCPYSSRQVQPFSMVNTDIGTWFQDLSVFMEQGCITGFADKFFRRVVTPIQMAWDAWKNKDDLNRVDTAIREIRHCKATDWNMACRQWLERRNK
jgi:thymidylate synthase